MKRNHAIWIAVLTALIVVFVLMLSRNGKGTQADDKLVPESRNAGQTLEVKQRMPMAWAIGDYRELQNTQRKMFSRIYDMEKKRRVVVGEIPAIVTDLAILAKMLDTISEPFAPINVSPPVFRADGTRYPPQTLLAGMTPSAIQNSEQRAAYEDILQKRDEASKTKNWLIEANLVHNSLFLSLKRELASLYRKGIITQVFKKPA